MSSSFSPPSPPPSLCFFGFPPSFVHSFASLSAQKIRRKWEISKNKKFIETALEIQKFHSEFHGILNLSGNFSSKSPPIGVDFLSAPIGISNEGGESDSNGFVTWGIWNFADDEAAKFIFNDIFITPPTVSADFIDAAEWAKNPKNPSWGGKGKFHLAIIHSKMTLSEKQQKDIQSSVLNVLSPSALFFVVGVSPLVTDEIMDFFSKIPLGTEDFSKGKNEKSKGKMEIPETLRGEETLSEEEKSSLSKEISSWGNRDFLLILREILSDESLKKFDKKSVLSEDEFSEISTAYKRALRMIHPDKQNHWDIKNNFIHNEKFKFFHTKFTQFKTFWEKQREQNSNVNINSK